MWDIAHFVPVFLCLCFPFPLWKNMIPWFIWYFLLIILFRINLQSQEGIELPINYFVGMTNQLGSLSDQLNSTRRCATPGCNGKRHKIFHPKCNWLVPMILLPVQNASMMDENRQWSKIFVCLLYEAKIKWLTWFVFVGCLVRGISGLFLCLMLNEACFF